MHKQLTSSNKLHNEENFLVCLENVLHTHQEWVISFQQNILLQKCTFDLIVIQNDVLSETLHCIDRLVGDLLHQEHLSKTTSANDTLYLEIFKIDFLLILVSLKHSVGSSLFEFFIPCIDLVKSST
jgi:hypothetical protein